MIPGRSSQPYVPGLGATAEWKARTATEFQRRGYPDVPDFEGAVRAPIAADHWFCAKPAAAGRAGLGGT